MSPVPSSALIAKYYETEYPATWDSEKITEAYELAPLSDIFSLVQQLVPRGALGLDFGCGYGGLVAALRNAGFTHVAGIDVSRTCIQQGRRRGGGPLYVTGTEPAAYRQQSCDFMVCSHVIEHVGNLDQCADEIKHRLMPGGLLFLALPNGGFLPAYQGHFKRYDWAQFPMHLNYFTSESVQRWLVTKGFKILDCVCGRTAGQLEWMGEHLGLDPDDAERVCSRSLVNRELIVVARNSVSTGRTSDPDPSSMFARRDSIHLERAFCDATNWHFLYGPEPTDLISLQPMSRVAAPVPTYKGGEQYCRIGSNFMHPGAREAAVVAYSVEYSGIYVLELIAQMVDARAKPCLYTFQVNNEILAEVKVDHIYSRTRVPVRARRGDKIIVAVSAPHGNDFSTIASSLSISLLFVLHE